MYVKMLFILIGKCENTNQLRENVGRDRETSNCGTYTYPDKVLESFPPQTNAWASFLACTALVPPMW